MAYVDFLTTLHSSTKRDYLGRVNEYPKAEAIKIFRAPDSRAILSASPETLAPLKVLMQAAGLAA